MFHWWKQLKQSEYYQRNKTVLILLFCWLFRLCFLLQGNVGGVAINKYVVVQIAMILGLFVVLYQKHFTPLILFQQTGTRGFALMYSMGVASLIWSVFPAMSAFFAFENLVCMTTLLYLALQCRDSFQLERIFVWMVIAIMGMFVLRTLSWGGGFHSVTYSSIGAMLLLYCVGEYQDENRPVENLKMLRLGMTAGAIILALTSSGGALFSTVLSLFPLGLLARRRMIRVLVIGAILVLLGMWYSGATEMLYAWIFPGKTLGMIESANGRTIVWEMINDKVAERPLLGWGYAAVERILPIYCTDAHNSIVGIRGALGNIGMLVLIGAMAAQLYYLFKRKDEFGFKGLFVATVCAFINSNTSNFLASKAGPCALTFQLLLILSAAYNILAHKTAYTKWNGKIV